MDPISSGAAAAAAAAEGKGKGKGKGKHAGLAGDGTGASGNDGGRTSDAEAFCDAIAAPTVQPPLQPLPGAAGATGGGVRGDGDGEETVRGEKRGNQE